MSGFRRYNVSAKHGEHGSFNGKPTTQLNAHICKRAFLFRALSAVEVISVFTNERTEDATRDLWANGRNYFVVYLTQYTHNLFSKIMVKCHIICYN